MPQTLCNRNSSIYYLVCNKQVLAAHSTHDAIVKTQAAFASLFHTENLLTDALMTHHQQNCRMPVKLHELKWEVLFNEVKIDE